MKRINFPSYLYIPKHVIANGQAVKFTYSDTQCYIRSILTHIKVVLSPVTSDRFPSLQYFDRAGKVMQYIIVHGSSLCEIIEYYDYDLSCFFVILFLIQLIELQMIHLT